MRRILFIILLFVSIKVSATEIFIEAESFDQKGGWVVDQQFMDLMGSPYLLAHGMGVKVEDASTMVAFAESAKYHIYVRTFNWTSPWYDGEGAGKFSLGINSKTIRKTLGDHGDKWIWQYVGSSKISKGEHRISLEDMTGFDGRCDAIYFSTEQTPPPSQLDE